MRACGCGPLLPTPWANAWWGSGSGLLLVGVGVWPATASQVSRSNVQMYCFPGV